MENYELPPKKKTPFKTKFKRIFITIIVIAIYIWTFLGIDIDWAIAFDRLINNFMTVIPRLFQPAWGSAGEVGLKLLETIFIAFAGTLMASILAIPLGFIAARNLTTTIIVTLGKGILSATIAFLALFLS